MGSIRREKGKIVLTVEMQFRHRGEHMQHLED